MTVTGDPISVLHVDDEPDFADMAGAYLERVDDRITVLPARSADEGLEMLADHDVDCVVSDYDMPHTNGVDFLESVRAEYPDLPFILYTGKGSEEIASDAISAGVTDYLQKDPGSDQYPVLANRITNAVEHHRSRQIVDRSRQRLREMVDLLPHFLYVVDERGDYVLANEVLADFHDTTVEDIEGSNVTDVLDGPTADEFLGDLAEVLEADEEKLVSEVEVSDPSGETHVFEPRVRPYEFGEGDTRAVLGVAADVTERKERERELERYEAYLEESTDIVTVLDETGSIEFQSPSVTRILGYEPGELIGRNGFEFIHPDDVDDVAEPFEDLVSDPGATVTVECRFRMADDEWRWLEVRGTNQLEHDAINGIVTNSRDITERKERQRDQERTATVLSTLFETLSVGVLAEDESGTVLAANQRLVELFDASGTPDDVVGADSKRLVEEISERFADPEGFLAGIDELAASNEPVRGEELTLGDGRTVARGHEPIELPDGEGHLWTYRDVTERRDRKRRLRQQTAFLENSPDAFFVLDADATVTYQSHASSEILGYEMRDLQGQSGMPYVHPDDRERVSRDVEFLLDNPGETVVTEFRFQIPTGEWRWYENRAINRLDDPAVDGILVVNRDITERKQREHRLEAINETTPELMSADTREAIAEIGVETARDILGLEASSIHLYDDEQSSLVPAAVSDRIHDLIGEPPTFTGENSIAWRVFQSGETRVIDDVGDDPDVYNPETSFRSELYLPLGECGILIAGSESTDAFDQQDVVLGEILAGNLASAFAQAERAEQLRERERELERHNDRLETFASVVSHDLRNPLNVAEGRLELAREDSDSEHLDAVARAHDRMTTLIDELLTLAHEGETPAEITSVDLTDLVESCWRNVDTRVATLHTAVDRTVRADESRLRQVFENLVRNAVEHGDRDVTVTVGGLDTGFYVEDDGPGIPPDERTAVFEAGYSTSEEGTGFGLSIVEQVAEAHDWDVRVTEGSDGGARFEVTGVEFADR